MKVTDVKHGYRGPKDAPFDEIKTELLKRLEHARAEGVVDEGVNQYLDMINSHEDYVTSSSCYGRIILIDLPDNTKRNSRFLSKWHRKVSVAEAWEALQKAEGDAVWFKMDPLIFHVSCRNIEAAEKLLKVKQSAGMKRGGIFSIAPNRVQAEFNGTYGMELPVKKEKVLIDKEYFAAVVEEANAKFEKNAKQWERFAEEFSVQLIR